MGVGFENRLEALGTRGWLGIRYCPKGMKMVQVHVFVLSKKKKGHYCPEGSETAVPCPRGMFAPSFWARDITGCISCPPHHYAPTEGLAACLPCGSRAQQPLPGQDKCVCLAEGQVFQASDGQCQCALGYRATQRGEACELKIYQICKDGQTRDQYGKCLDHRQWKHLCTHEVCASAQLYEGYDVSLGLCVCKSLSDSGRSECSGWCGDRMRPVLQLVCSPAVLTLIYTEANRQVQHTGPSPYFYISSLHLKGMKFMIKPYCVSASGSALLSVFKHWESRGRLRCEQHHGFSRPVYTIQTRESGFYGFLGTIPAEVRMSILEGSEVSDSFVEIMNRHSVENHTYTDTESYWSMGPASRGARNREAAQVMNPIACLHLEDILLFTVTRHHYPQYDVFSEPGVYVLKLSSNQHKHMYVKVLPAGGDCYDIGPFFPTDPHHMIRMGITIQRQVLLRPDWWVIGGLLAGATVVLCLCLVVLILFREHGWPEKLPFQARYRDLQLKYNMDDYSSKGSRVMALKKTHRNLQAGMNEDPILRAMAETSDEFWDYEEQVNLEAFSSSTFYEILLKHSVSVTSQLGQLREEVKQLYQGVLEKICGLQPDRWAMAVGCKLECLERQVEQEITRRKVLGTQISQLLESQLQILRNESQSQHAMHKAFSALLREGFRLLMLVSDSQASLWNKHIQQCVMDRVTVLAEEMAELVSVEAERQGCWVVLKQGTGARLLCPTSGSVLTRDDIISPDGSVRACDTVHVDPCTGLIHPISNAHMLLASGHSMPVPSDFFLHPQTGRLLPMAGNVGFDPSSSSLVYTADACMGEVGKWESPVIPFIPYPSSHHSELLGPSKLRSLQPGQKLVFGGPMYDYETGVLVPIMAVTSHPQTGAVYPVGGVHVCPVTRLLQPIQIGCPMLDPRTGNVVLITGVSLDSQTGVVLPVGGLLLSESFIEPLSGRLVRVGGGSIRGGKVVPHAGGFQALLDSQALGARVRVVELIRASCEEWKSGSPELQNEISRVKAAASDLEQAWRNSQHCMLQLLSCLEAQQEWAWWVSEDGGSLGQINLPNTELSLPALPGLEYPDPGGSGLSVPVLGEQMDWMLGRMVPLAGTMEDADGKGLVPIRFGAQTVDPVTGVVGPVVGAWLDVWKRTVVPVTVSQCLNIRDTPDTVLAEALQKECSMRAQFWRQQRVKEEELVADLDRALLNCFYTALQEESDHFEWTDTEKQIKETAAELQEAVNKEAQRRNAVKSELSLLLPGHILLTLTGGDEEEWKQQQHWHTELTAVLNRVSVFMARQQWEQDRSINPGDEQPDEKSRQKELWEQLKQRHAELDVALSSVHWACELSQLRADTAEAILSGSFSYRDYGMVQHRVRKNPLKAMALTQKKILPQLDRLIQLLEEGKLYSLFMGTQSHRSSDLPMKQVFDRDTSSRAWTVSVPVAKDANQFCCAAVSAQSLKDHEKALSVSKLNGLKPVLSRTSPTHTEQDVSPAQSQGEDWASLLELSPLFQLIQDVEQQLSDQAKSAGFLSGEHTGSWCPFIDFLDAQWDCEGELVKVAEDTLNPREFLIFQHGQLLLQLLHTHRVAPAVELHLASSLPTNNYRCNAFRNSFYYQVGCELEEKERFWSELDEVMESIPTGERVVIGADSNGHVGEGNRGDEEVMGKFGVKERNLEGQMFLPDDWEATAEVIRETGRKVLGMSSGRRKEDKETWWWNEEVQDSVQRKRLAKKKWDMDRTEENRQEYKELQCRVKREVSKAKQKAYDELYTRLDTREGEKDLYRLARQRDRNGKDVQQVRVIKDRDGRVLTSEESVQRRWKEYFEELMNEENEREKRVEGVNSVEQKVDKIRKDEVRKSLKRMKSGKAVGPDYIPVEVWKCLGEAAVEFLTSLFNRVLESERMPEEWRRSVLVPIFKNKGDVQSCSNYRGIKLMSHTMKVWERVVEARLRKVVEVCEQQYGFMPRKSTTDAVSALRILMEKYRDGQRELHCVFVDLEKAYDRVPREELWYCMRKSGVAEKYVRVVQDMYERSRTVVSESREKVEENLERWKFALERRGMKVSRSKTEYMCVNEREGSGTVRLQGEEVKKVQEFKYLGSTVQSNGVCGKEEMDNTLYVRQQRLQSVGGFSLLLLHCAAHISTGQLSVDTTADFQRAFFKVLQVCLSELFHARLELDAAEGKKQSSVSALNSLVFDRVQKLQPEIVSESLNVSQLIVTPLDEVARLLEKHKESSLFRKVESLLRDKNLEVSPSDGELPIKHGAEGRDAAVPE
ncbi:hypothetical protein QTP70_028289 [Hemibagrus guttatus]|uniref:Reverse transcriptase domain-containing protein n=1 Tax=Hemibagrus guttatus TaxID=175788 RepID=A0AAE0UZW2_9TELE|nr:hypothetical protein QTP70_028289 [Hemibagrus guttatus]